MGIIFAESLEEKCFASLPCPLTHTFRGVFQPSMSQSMYACMHRRMHVCTHAYMHACMHACMFNTAGTWMLWQNGWGLGGRYHGWDMDALAERMGSGWTIPWLGHGCSGRTDGVTGFWVDDTMVGTWCSGRTDGVTGSGWTIPWLGVSVFRFWILRPSQHVYPCFIEQISRTGRQFV